LNFYPITSPTLWIFCKLNLLRNKDF
jgi:hypothetical protein